MIIYHTPDLTQHPPRSPRARLGGYVHLPRLLDKARAFATGKNGEYNYNSGLDKRLFEFTGFDGDVLLAAVKTGKSDTEILAWVNENTQPRRTQWEIDTWSAWLERLPPGDAQRHTLFAELIQQYAPSRQDIRTLFDRLDFDDYVSFGGHV